MKCKEDVPILLPAVEAQAAGIAIPRTLLRPKETARADGFLNSNHLLRPFLRVDDIGRCESIVKILRRQPHGLVADRKP